VVRWVIVQRCESDLIIAESPMEIAGTEHVAAKFRPVDDRRTVSPDRRLAEPDRVDAAQLATSRAAAAAPLFAEGLLVTDGG